MIMIVVYTSSRVTTDVWIYALTEKGARKYNYNNNNDNNNNIT